MTKEEKEFYVHKHYAKSSNPIVVKPKVEVWQLVYKATGERIIHGQYSLCSWKQKQCTKPEGYKIIPFKK